MLTYILFRGNYTNSWQARLHTGKMLMDFSNVCMRGLRTSSLSSAKKLKEKLDQKIEDLQQPKASNHTAASSSQPAHAARIAAFERRNGPGIMDQLYAKLK